MRLENEEEPKYPIRAQELANWLASPAAAMPKSTFFPAKTFPKAVSGKRGIIFFKDYWGAGNQGDHIDLWNGTRLTHLRSLAQIYACIGSFGLGSDYRAAKGVQFWLVP
jgi:hypothetical protein